MPQRRAQRRQSGATSIQVLVLLVPVLFGFMGLAIDLGRLYMARGELQTAAHTMAVAAAQRLYGTDTALAESERAAALSLESAGGLSNRYDFGGLTIGSSNGSLESVVEPLEYYDTAANALASQGTNAAGATARYVRVHIRSEAPLVFFGFLSVGQTRKTPIEVDSVAGVSNPVCTACNIEPLVIPAIDITDLNNFGYVPGALYTLGYVCTGPRPPGPLAGTVARIDYLLLNRYDTNNTVFTLEPQQTFRIGANGLPGNNATPALSCVSLNTDETHWASAAPQPCASATGTATLTGITCGLAARFDSVPNDTCSSVVTDAGTLAGLYTQDTDLTETLDYAAYTGNGRRLITIGVVTTLDILNPMQVLAFRQFLVEPDSGGTTLTAGDADGRFRVMYLGTVAPVRQGRFDGGCGITLGPGKVVLHR